MTQPQSDDPSAFETDPTPMPDSVPGYQSWAPPVAGVEPMATYGHPQLQAQLMPVRGWANAAIGVAVFVTICQLYSASLAPEATRLFRQGRAQGLAPIDVPTPMDLVAIPLLLGWLASLVVTSVWLKRMRDNAVIINPSARHTRAAYWAWLGWIVPIVSLWFPYQVVRDTRAATVHRSRRDSTLLGWWWVCWLMQLFTSQFVGRVESSRQLEPDLTDAIVGFEWASTAFLALALVLWVGIIRQMTADQETAYLVQGASRR